MNQSRKSINSIITFKIGTALLCAILLIIIVANMAIPICFFNSLKDINRDITKSINLLFSNTIVKTQTIFDMISSDDEMLDALRTIDEIKGEDAESILKRRKIVSDYITDDIVRLRSMNLDVVNDIIITSKNAEEYIYSSAYSDNKNILEYIRTNSTSGVSMFYLDEFSGYDWVKTHMYMLARPIFDRDGREVGKVVFLLNSEIIDMFEKKNNIFIIKNNDVIFKKTDKATSLDNIKNADELGIYDNENTDYIRTISGKKYLVSYDTSNPYGWLVVNLVSVDEIYESVNAIKILSIVVSLVFFVLFALVLRVFSKRISKKLSIVISEMNMPDKISDFEQKSTLLKKIGFRTKMMVLAVVTIMVPALLFTGILCIRYIDIIRTENAQLVDDYTNLKGYIIERNITNAENVIKYVLTDDLAKQSIYNLHTQPGQDSYKAVTENIGKLLPEDMSVRIRIYNHKGQLVYAGFEDFENVLANSQTFTPPDGIATSYEFKKDETGITEYVIKKKILGSKGYYDYPLGYVEVILSEDTLLRDFKDDGSYFEYVILSGNDEIVRSKLPTVVGTDVENVTDILAQRMLNKRYISTVNLKNHFMKVYVLYQNEMSDLYNLVLVMCMLMTCLVCLIMTLYTGRKLSSYVLKPVYIANNEISKVEVMKLDGDMPERNEGDELDGLIEGVNDMKIKIRELIDDLYQQKIMEKELETIALQTQIAPHFLYNTLETINALVDMGDNTRACDMICLLSEFFRKGISRQKHILTLKEEIDYTEIYIQIQKIRFGDDLIVVWELGDVMECKIVNFALQPLIENSLKHGNFSSDETKIIRIKAYKAKDKLKLAVIDNGNGIDADALLEMNESFARSGIPSKNIGLKNISDRIKLYFGEQYGLKIYSKKNKGTIVRIELPIEM